MNAWNFYTTKEIRPQGWLRQQLKIQAAGPSGNLDRIWRDIRDSAWIGGDAEGWERVPYWLDGFIPLAYLLEDEDIITRTKNTSMPSSPISAPTDGSVPAVRRRSRNTTPGRFSSSPRCWWSTTSARETSASPMPFTVCSKIITPCSRRIG